MLERPGKRAYEHNAHMQINIFYCMLVFVSSTGMIKWFVYILQCCDKSLYVGISTDVTRRIDIHNSGKGAAYTRSRLPAELVYVEKMKSESDARKREAEIKKWKRAEKLDLANRYSKRTISASILVDNQRDLYSNTT